MKLLISLLFFVFGCVFGRFLNKCRVCGLAIALPSPVIESVTGTTFLLTAMQYGFSLHGILCCFFICCLILDACIDFKTMELPDRLAAAIFFIGLIRFAAMPSDRLSLLIGAVIISLPLFLTALITGGFGGGDIKLCASAGFFLGFPAVMLGTIIGFIIGSAYAVLLIIRRKAGRKTLFPFGPFLCFGFFIAALYTDSILHLFYFFYLF